MWNPKLWRKKCVIILIASILIYLLIFEMFNRWAFSAIRTQRTYYLKVLENEDTLISTEGCTIPDYGKNLRYSEATYYSRSRCGERAVTVKKISESEVMFKIHEEIMERIAGNYSYRCCYKFMISTSSDLEKTKTMKYTKCDLFESGTIVELKHEIIVVICEDPTDKYITFYKDAYLFVKKLPRFHKLRTMNRTKSWNVLLMGMDTMSRARFYQSMPETAIYFEDKQWLDYRGYHKIDYNTFPNLMAVLSGKNKNGINYCGNNNMDKCNTHMIWSKYRNTGYITAYGEDDLKLPDTFSGLRGYKTKTPTDHYARPFFHFGERMVGNIICAGMKSSGHHLLDYALDFVETYKDDKFFGVFWINSYSHHLVNIPTLIDENIRGFFETSESSGILDNTFVFFFSDHGSRFGKMRAPIESYYDERLPMFCMWVPYEFRIDHTTSYENLKVNQNRLTTPYDFHITLWRILQFSQGKEQALSIDGCPECTSLFEEKSVSRTCSDAHISSRWCSCHGVKLVEPTDAVAYKSVEASVYYIGNITMKVKTKLCTKCILLKLKRVLRHHFYEDSENQKKYYVLAFEMTPGNIRFETIVEQDGGDVQLVEPVYTISEYRNRQQCSLNKYEHLYCVCYSDPRCIYRQKHKPKSNIRFIR